MRMLAWFIALMVMVGASKAGVAAVLEDLYDAEVIITGTGAAERERGFRDGLREVVVRLTGSTAVLADRRLTPLFDRPGAFVAAFDYEDRMKGIPVHDEQGTRERPHFLRMQFDSARLDAALEARGVALWGTDRPLLVVWLGVRDWVRDYVLAAEGDPGYGQRAVLLETARRRGVPIVLPAMDATDRAAVTYDVMAAPVEASLAKASRRYGADGWLFGTLVLGPEGYWDMVWTLRIGESRHTWALVGVTFDAALRSGIRQSAQILAERD